ncbi:MAG: bifunctional UDP-N-acetylmuramoyl-tripeptide:D-alanyl-D-alanine ligase/alanine racemase [Bacteroidales bacterium]|nr:bifunctional UDP-N-acetylmuramoyl-tripeptide:D-alanyl-D-alanine ligase/alanine racemase [Bacteroidales bacterium]
MRYYSSDIAGITGGRITGRPDLPVTDIITDSRNLHYTGEIAFIAIQGIHHDGHLFIDPLFARGVKVFIVAKMPDNIDRYPGSAFILASDTVEALQRLAGHLRKLFRAPVIGITGSAGKTVVKEWLADILGLAVPVVRSPRSYNSQIGVPLSLLKLDDRYEYGIFEAGISMKGEMEKLAAIMDPDIGVFTNIGDAHDENFPDKESKVEEKLKLFKKTPVLIYCRDHNPVRQAIMKNDDFRSKEIFDWSFKDPAARIFVRKLPSAEGTSRAEITFDGSASEFTIPFSDPASVENATAVIAVCLSLGIENNIIKRGVSGLVSVAMRMDIKSGINNCQLIEDYYNSDPGSLRMALEYMKLQNRPKTTLILSDFIQSGRNEEELYGEVAELIRRAGIDKFIGIGETLVRNSRNFDSGSKFYWSTDEFIQRFNPSDHRDEAILLKGARMYEFERIGSLLELQTHSTVLEINLDNILHNLNEFRKLLNPGTGIMAMVKAFAYGAGASEIAGLLEYHRVGYFGVSCADEGMELRRSGVTLPVLVMNPDPSAFGQMIRYNLEPELYNFSSLGRFIEVASKHGLLHYPVHIKIDSGMHRLGFLPGETGLLGEMIRDNECVRVISVFSHLAGSDDPSLDEFTQRQAGIFLESVEKIRSMAGYPFLIHILNTSGIVRFPEYQFDMVRPGIGLYGIGRYKGINLKPAGTFKTRISQIKRIPAGEPVGYNCADVADYERIIAILPVGYADGLNRKLGNRKGNLFIKGRRVLLIGNICMDMCSADITGIDLAEGDEAEIFGENIRIEEIAEICGTIPYEMLTSIPARVKRIFYRE